MGMTHTLSGNVLSFQTAEESNITSLKCNFSCNPNYHGFNGVWPGGTGKNKLGFKTASEVADGTNRIIDFTENYIKVTAAHAVNGNAIIGYPTAGDYCRNTTIPAGTYTFSVQDFSSNIPDFSKSNIRFITTAGQIFDGETSTFTENVEFMFIGYSTTFSWPEGAYIMFKLQLEEGSNVTSWEPYENICTFSTWNKLSQFQTSSYIDLTPINFTSQSCGSANFTYLGENTFQLDGVDTSGTAVSMAVSFDIKKNTTYNFTVIRDPDHEMLPNLTDFGIQFKQGNQSALLMRPNGAWVNNIFASSYTFTEDYHIDTLKFGIVRGNGRFKIKIIITENNIKRNDIIFPAIGKNLLDKSTYGFKAYDSLVFGGTNQASDGTFFLNAGTYTLSVNNIMSYLIIEHENKSINMLTNTNTITFTCSSKEVIRIIIMLNGQAQDHDMLQYNYQLELGDTATTYEPFNNILYGGYVDLITGNIYKNRTKVLIDGTQTMTDRGIVSGTSVRCIAIAAPQFPETPTGNVYVYTDRFTRDSDQNKAWTFWVEAINKRLKLYIPSSYSLSDFTEYLKNNPVEYVFRVEDILVGHLSPQELQTYKQYNTIWTNSNDTTEVTYEFNESTDILAIRKKIIASAPHIETIEGSRYLQFNTDISHELKNYELSLYPQQAGSGEPSVTNIRNISPIGYVIIDSLGKNIYDANTATIVPGHVRNDSGNESASSYYFYISTMYPVEYPQAITVGNVISDAFRLYYLDANGGMIERGTYIITQQKSAPGTTFFPPENCKYFQMQFLNTSDISDLEVRVGTASTIYLSREIGDVYGGYMDLNQGTFIQTYGSFTTTWGNYDSGYATVLGNTERRVFTSPEVDFLPIGSLFYDDASHYCNVAQSFGSNTSWNIDQVQYILGNKTCILKLPVGTSDDTEIQFVAKLKNPITYQLDPQIFTTFKGENNQWIYPSNSIMKIKYWTH